MIYKYSVVRSARKSIAVSVSAENKITVRCGWNIRPEEIEKFLDGKADWIEKVVLQNSKKLAVNDDIIELKSIYVSGKKYPLIFCGKNEICADAVYVKSKNDICKLYIKTFFADFKERVEAFAEKYKFYPADISVKDYTSRWGCCDAQNNLIFNYKLFMLPQDLQDYVIIHELCHTICHNHSNAFWRLVGEVAPDYKEKRNGLKNFDFLTTLY